MKDRTNLEHQRDVFERDIPNILAHAAISHYFGKRYQHNRSKLSRGLERNELIWTIAVEGISSR
jgi:hypothetical protein